jgi:phage-related minor tail protein
MADLNITAAVVVSTENAEAGFDRIGDKAERMATDVAGAAGKAGAAVDKIGDGAAKGAENLTRSESRIRDSIKRTTQDLNLLGKTASEKLEFKINDKGLDLSKFSGYIDELKKAEQAQLALSAASANAGAAASGSLNKIGISAAQTANALRGVPAQFTDIVVSLQGGQKPLTVLLQQGGQLKDMFGGVGNAAQALGGYVVGLINPFTVAAAAAGALGLAYFKGSQEATEFSKALILSGNASGATAGQLQGFAQAISKVTGTQGAAAAALTEFAASGKVGADNLQRFSQAAVQFEKATGTAVSETVKQFAELGKAPVEASVKLNEQINYLTVSVYKQIKALEDQGRATEAANLAQTTFADTLAARTGQIVANVGYIEGAWKAVKNAISGAADAAMNVGRAPTNQDRIDTKRKEIGNTEALIASGNLPSAQAVDFQTKLLEQKKQELSLLTESERVIKRTVEGQAQQAAITKQYIDFTKQGAEFATKSEKREKELLKATTEGQALVNAGLLTQVDLNVRLAGIRDKYKESDGAKGPVDPFIAVMKGINERVAAVKLEIEQGDKLTAGQKVAAKVLEDVRNGTLKLTEAKAALLGKGLEELLQGEALRIIDVARLKATEDANKQRQQSLDATIKDTASLQEQINKQLDQTASIGLSKEAIAALTAQRELDKASTLEGLAIKELDRNLDVQQFDATMAKVQAMRDLATAQKDGGARETAAEEAKKATAEWKKFSDSVYTGLTDSLYRAFESGKGFFKSFWDGIRNLFKTTVLKLAIQGVVTGVTGSLGFSGPANAAGGGSSAGGFDFSSITNPMASLSNAFTKFAGSSTGQSLGLSNSSAIAGNNPSAFAPAGTQLTSTGSAMGTALGVVGDTLAGYAMGSMARSLISDGYSAGKGMDTFQKVGIAVGSAIGGPLVGAAIGAGAGVFNRLFGRKLDDTGIQGTFGGMRGFEGNSFEKLKGGFFRSDKTNTSALAEDTRAALGDAFGLIRVQVGTFATALGLDAERINGFTSTISLSLKGLDPKAAEAKIQEALANAGNQLASSFDTGGFAKAGETSLATLERLATSLGSVNAALGLLDKQLLTVSLAGGDAASKLADAFGGLDKMAASSKAFFDAFYSEAEQIAKAQSSISATLAEIGLAVPLNKGAFRDLALSMDLTTDAGRKAYATLLTIAPQFAQVADAVAEQSKKIVANLLAGYAEGADIDFAKLTSSLAGASLDVFAETVSAVFTRIGKRVSSVLDGLASERQAVAGARLQIDAPRTLSRDEIARRVAAVTLNAPGNAGATLAQGALSQADAQVLVKKSALAQAQAMQPSSAGFDAAIVAMNSTNATAKAALANVANYRTMEGGKFNSFVDYGYGLNSNPGRFGPSNSGENNAVRAVQAEIASRAPREAAQRTYDLQSAAYTIGLLESARRISLAQADLGEAVNSQSAAVTQARAAQLAYVASLQDFAIEAGRAVGKLSKLREETVKYFEAQRELASVMTTSASNLRAAIQQTRFGQLDSAQALVERQRQFAGNYSMALSTTGAEQAGYADKLASALPELSVALMDVSGNRTEWVVATARLLAQSETIAAQLAASAPKDYAAESLLLLDSIDAAINAIEANAQSAERIISDAVSAGSEKTAGGLRAVIAAITGQPIPDFSNIDYTPVRDGGTYDYTRIRDGGTFDDTILTHQGIRGFANGGMFGGGLRIVGENGPELEATGPSRIFNASQTRNMLSGDGSAEVVTELRALRRDNANMRAELQAIAQHTSKTTRILDRVSQGGDSLKTAAA